MSNKATYVAGKPAVTETIVVEPAIQPKIILELTRSEASDLLALTGNSCGVVTAIYNALSDMAQRGEIQRREVHHVAATSRTDIHIAELSGDKPFAA